MQPTDPRDAQIAALRKLLRRATLYMPKHLSNEASVIDDRRLKELHQDIRAALAAAPAAKQESGQPPRLCTCYSHQFSECRGAEELGAGWTCEKEYRASANAKREVGE